MKRGLLYLGGMLALGAGVAGIFLPLIPTTPFLLLSSYCFVRSSPTAHRWLLTHRWFGPYLRDWEERGGVRRGVKVVAVLAVIAAVSALWLSRGLPLIGSIAGTLLAGVGLYVVWRLPIAQPEAPPSLQPQESTA